MKVIAYETSNAFHLKSWFEFYQIEDALLEEIPSIGFIAIENGMIYAMGFLRRIEACSYAMLDGLIANPWLAGKKRYLALDLIFQKLKQTAKELGLKKIIGQTNESAVLKRSIKHGFKKLSHIVLVAET